MYKAVKFVIEGVTPTIMHNGRLADPLDEFAKKIKEISGKRKKTDEDYIEMAHLEFMGSLYMDDSGPCWPGENIERGIIDAAKEQKLGKQFTKGILCDGLWPLIYKGPKDGEKMWEDGGFRDTRKARVGQASIMRTRPIFREWKLEFVVHFRPDIVNEAQLVDAVKVLGRNIGLSDHRPRFGKFEVKEHEAVKVAA